MSEEKKVITIPLSKILIVAGIIFVLFQIFSPNKKESGDESEKKETDTAKTAAPAPRQSSRNPRMSFEDVSQSLRKIPPDLAQGIDTVSWGRGKIIRHFSIDTTLQRRTENMVRRARTRYGAAVAINPKTGQILAMVSQQDPELPVIAENLVLSNEFPAASIIKTITAEAAFEYMPDITTANTKGFTGRSPTLFRSQFMPREAGANATQITFAEAFARSNNPIFGRLAVHHIGRERLARSAQKFGWNSNIPFEMPVDVSHFPETTVENMNDSINLAFLGSGFTNETTLTPLLGALIASTVVNNGNMMRPTIVDSITDMSGRVLYSAEPRQWKNSTASDIADSLKILMRATSRIGSARNSFNDFRTFARTRDITFGGKTGTKSSSHGRNEWFVGFAQDSENDFSIATSIVFTQRPKFILRPSQVSADMMLDYVRRTRRQIHETDNISQRTENEQ